MLLSAVTVSTTLKWSYFCTAIVLADCSRCQKITVRAYHANVYINAGQLDWLASEESIGRIEYPDAK